jgi:hypothetical protein
MKKRNIIFLILGLIALAIALSGCADVSHVQECLPIAEHTYGFWAGTWHGIITGLIWDDIAIYAVNNNGGWYDFGFVGGFFTMLKIIGLILKSR